jgi:hypothetical protein
MTRIPADVNNAADTQNGTVVSNEAAEDMGMIKAMMPPTRLAAAAKPLLVPRCGAGKTSGVYAYRMPYIAPSVILVTQLNAKICWLFVAAANKKMNTPLRMVDRASATFSPNLKSS